MDRAMNRDIDGFDLPIFKTRLPEYRGGFAGIVHG